MLTLFFVLERTAIAYCLLQSVCHSGYKMTTLYKRLDGFYESNSLKAKAVQFSVLYYEGNHQLLM